MKSPVYYLILILFIVPGSSCTKNLNENTPHPVVLTGRWKLTETLADPGDGSGKWARVKKNENFYIEFDKNGGFSSAQSSNINTYRVTDSVTIEFTLNDKTTHNYRYYINRSILTLMPPCIEPCGMRYVRIQ